MTGPAFAMATRLQAIAQPDTVVVSDQTRKLARRSHVFSFRGSHAIKGFAEPERVWRALSHKREVDRFFAFGRLEQSARQSRGRARHDRRILGQGHCRTMAAWC